jgi:NADH-quinone oxidoreductase subunit N
MPAYYLEALTVTLGLILLMAEAFVSSKSKAWVGVAAAIGLGIILCLTFIAIGPEAKPAAAWAKWPLWNFYQFDSLARFYKVFALVTTLFVVLLAVDYRKILARFTDHPGSENGTGEFYALPVFACAGMMWLASAKDLAGAFVALELVTVTFYVLVAYMRRNVGSLEAGVKYLILGALSTGFLVYGIAWVYGTTGTMSLAHLPSSISSLESPIPLLFGIALVMVGLGFKIGAVPMQVWIPDVYQGAPTPTTAFLSVGSKAAGFILTIRFLEPFLASETTRGPVLTLLLILTAATLLFGNLAAIPQTNFKRLLAYSSIAHAGFLLLALAAGKSETLESLGSSKVVSFYLATYLHHDARRVLHPRPGPHPARRRDDQRLQRPRENQPAAGDFADHIAGRARRRAAHRRFPRQVLRLLARRGGSTLVGRRHRLHRRRRRFLLLSQAPSARCGGTPPAISARFPCPPSARPASPCSPSPPSSSESGRSRSS